MVRLGVTGGIGSGKSTVCRFLENWGAGVFYADEQAKRIMVEDPELRALIIAAFGDRSYHADGSLNRPYLADRSFGAGGQIGVLNAMVHPRVFRAFERFAEEGDRQGLSLVVRETALMLEDKGGSGLDLIVAVLAPTNTRVRRVVGRDRTQEDAVRDRMSHQLTESEFRDRADRVILNDGSLDELREKAARLFSDLMGHPPE